MVQFYPWFNFYFPLFLYVVMYDNEYTTKEGKNWTKDKIDPEHVCMEGTLVWKAGIHTSVHSTGFNANNQQKKHHFVFLFKKYKIKFGHGNAKFVLAGRVALFEETPRKHHSASLLQSILIVSYPPSHLLSALVYSVFTKQFMFWWLAVWARFRLDSVFWSAR